MKLKTITLLLSSVLISGAYAAGPDQGHGQIKFNGSIIDAPCSITPETSNQEVYMGQISSMRLKDGGKSVPVDFQIDLENCDTETLKSVKATFTGAPSAGNPDLLGVTGSARGASIALTDGSGTLVKLGEATAKQTIMDGSNTLAFSAYLQGDVDSGTGKGVEIVPGEFSSIVNYALTYQ